MTGQESAWQNIQRIVENARRAEWQPEPKPILREEKHCDVQPMNHRERSCEVKKLLLERFCGGEKRLALLGCYNEENSECARKAGVSLRTVFDTKKNALFYTPRNDDVLRVQQCTTVLDVPPPENIKTRHDLPHEHFGLYDCAAAFFSLQRYFATKHSAKRFLKNVAAMLDVGGHFVCFFHSGSDVREAVKSNDRSGILIDEHLCIERGWNTTPSGEFGGKYALREMEQEENYDGCLVYQNVLCGVAKECGLRRVALEEEDKILELMEPVEYGVPLYRFMRSSGCDSLSRLEMMKKLLIFRRL
jgi:mRNA capping enzyme